jgi:hypothetical protein
MSPTRGRGAGRRAVHPVSAHRPYTTTPARGRARSSGQPRGSPSSRRRSAPAPPALSRRVTPRRACGCGLTPRRLSQPLRRRRGVSRRRPSLRLFRDEARRSRKGSPPSVRALPRGTEARAPEELLPLTLWLVSPGPYDPAMSSGRRRSRLDCRAVTRVALIPACEECRKLWLPGDEEHWHAYWVDDGNEDCLLFYCPDCVEREFSWRSPTGP